MVALCPLLVRSSDYQLHIQEARLEKGTEQEKEHFICPFLYRRS